MKIKNHPSDLNCCEKQGVLVRILVPALGSRYTKPGVVEYFGTRMNRNRFRNILGYFGTIPIYPASSGRIFRNRQDISEPLPSLCDAQYLTLHNR